MAERPEAADLAQLTAGIVSAYVSKNATSPSELADLITAVAEQLNRVGGEPEQPAEGKPEPAVPVRRSIRPDHLVCMVCGKAQKVLKRHLAVQHGLTPAQYRERFGLKPDYPMAAPNFVQQRRDVAVAIGLGRQKKPAQRGRKAGTGPRAAEQSQPEAGG